MSGLCYFCQLIPLKLWPNTAQGCNHNQLACPSYNLYVQLLWYPMYYPRGMKWPGRGTVVVTAYDFESGRPGSNPEWGYYTMRLLSLHRAYPSIHPSGVVHWVPEQLNIKAVTGACKLIDGCSLALCSATVSVVSAGIYATEIKSIQLHDSIVGLSQKTVSFTFTCILHLQNRNNHGLVLVE